MTYEELYERQHQLPKKLRMKECRGCDGYGIMQLHGGLHDHMTAPCLECSPRSHLFKLEQHRDEAVRFLEQIDGKKKMAEYMKTMGECEGW